MTRLADAKSALFEIGKTRSGFGVGREATLERLQRSFDAMPVGVMSDADDTVVAVLADFPALIDADDGQARPRCNLSVFDCSHTL